LGKPEPGVLHEKFASAPRAKRTSKKKNKVEGLILPDFRFYYLFIYLSYLCNLP